MTYVFVNASNFEIIIQAVTNDSLCGTFLKPEQIILATGLLMKTKFHIDDMFFSNACI